MRMGGGAGALEAWLPGWKGYAAGGDGAREGVRVLAFHWAGGSASSYNLWAKELAGEGGPLEGARLLAVQLPGREGRKTEPAPSDAQSAARGAAEALAPLLAAGEPPYAIFAHSMGCLVAFEFMREVRRRGLRNPACAILSNFPAPQTPEGERPWLVSRTLDEEGFKGECRAWGVKPVVMTPSFWPQFYQPFRADFRIFDEYKYSPEPPLDVPLTIFLSDSDPRIKRRHVEGWAEQTTSKHFAVVSHEGDHFYVQERPAIPKICAALGEIVEAALEREDVEKAAREKCPAGEVGDKLTQMTFGKEPAAASPAEPGGDDDDDDIDCF